jgi:hypothetical protein
MGAWDFGPFENDDASDFWYGIRSAKNPIKFLKKALSCRGDGWNNERRAAAAFVKFLDSFDRRTMSTLKKDARKALEDLIASNFADDWKDPDLVKKLLKKELKSLR